MERVNPIFITDKESGKRYELDFNREAVLFAEDNGFKTEEVTYKRSAVENIFYFAFRWHHRHEVDKKKALALLEGMGGVSVEMLARLVDLYNQAGMAHVLAVDEDAKKNATVTVEL